MSELLLVIDDAVSSVIGRYLTVWIDGRLYGISVASVHETIGAVEAASDRAINLRGQTVPVIDLRATQGGRPSAWKPGPLVVLNGMCQRQTAVVVDAVEGVVDISVDEFHLAEEAGRPVDAWVSAVVECDIGTVELLDIESLVADTHLAVPAVTAAETLV